MKLNIKDYNKYNKYGVIRLKKAFSADEISKLKKNINYYIKNNKSKLKGKEINYINGKINSIHLFKGEFFKKFLKQKKIIKIGNFFLKDSAIVKHYEYFAKPKKIGLPSPMHQDNYYWNLKNSNALTMWIAIDQATSKNGSVEYLIASHKKLYKHVPSFAPGSSQKIKDIVNLKKKFKKKSFSLQVGDCLIHHSLIIHGSKKNDSEYSRRGFTVQLMSKNTKVDKKKFQMYQKSLNKQIKLRKNLNKLLRFK